MFVQVVNTLVSLDAQFRSKIAGKPRIENLLKTCMLLCCVCTYLLNHLFTASFMRMVNFCICHFVDVCYVYYACGSARIAAAPGSCTWRENGACTRCDGRDCASRFAVILQAVLFSSLANTCNLKNRNL